MPNLMEPKDRQNLMSVLRSQKVSQGLVPTKLVQNLDNMMETFTPTKIVLLEDQESSE